MSELQDEMHKAESLFSNIKQKTRIAILTMLFHRVLDIFAKTIRQVRDKICINIEIYLFADDMIE